MLWMGKVVGSEVDVNTEGDDRVRLLSVEIEDETDPQTAEMANHGGIDYNPSNEAVAIIDDVGESYKVVSGIDDGIEPVVDRGEIEMYSTSEDGTTKEARVKCVNDGIVEVNGDADFAVRFNKLQEAFNQLQSDHDALVDLYNAHIHVTTATVLVGAVGVIAPTTSTGSPSTADIEPAKVEEVKLP